MSNTATEPTNEPQGTNEGEQQQAPTVEDLQAQIEDLKKHSRKWEDRAKENYSARQELDKLREAQMSEEEKRAAALEAASKKAAEAEARAEKAALDVQRFRIAAQHGISDEDAELFLTGSDEETLKKQAERLSANRSSAGPRPNPSQGNRSGAGPTTPADALGDFFDSNF